MPFLTKRIAASGLAACSVAAALVAIGATPASASWYGATTGGTGANIRDCYHPTVNLPPNTSCTFRASVAAWTGVRIVCQRQGQSVSGYYGTTDLWDYVVWEGGSGRPEGFASDANINTGYAYWIPGIDICQ
jgi:hypothetical protein